MSTNKKLALISLVILLGFVFVTLDSKQIEPIEESSGNVEEVGDQKTLSIGSAKIEIEIADDPAERSRGLSGRESLGENEGLLFIFEKPGIYSFWMKEMLFPIDIIWIDQNWAVVEITKNAAPESFPGNFTPRSPAQYVLETNSGFADEAKINLGDEVIFSNLFDPNFME